MKVRCYGHGSKEKAALTLKHYIIPILLLVQNSTSHFLQAICHFGGETGVGVV